MIYVIGLQNKHGVSTAFSLWLGPIEYKAVMKEINGLKEKGWIKSFRMERGDQQAHDLVSYRRELHDFLYKEKA